MKSVIFDMDGTILDTIDDIRNAINYSLNKYNLAQITTDECKSFLGNGPKKLIERSVKDRLDMFGCVFDTYNSYYASHNDIYTKPYDGILELLIKLKSEGYKLAVVSNKADSDAKMLAAKYFSGIFDIVLGSSENILKKPHPDMVLKVMEYLNTKEAVYVGDSEVDVKTSINAKIKGIFVLWGFRDKKTLELNGAKVTASNALELYNNI